jgi:hypothetical protein
MTEHIVTTTLPNLSNTSYESYKIESEGNRILNKVWNFPNCIENTPLIRFFTQTGLANEIQTNNHKNL